jgi:hypothetical protein
MLQAGPGPGAIARDGELLRRPPRTGLGARSSVASQTIRHCEKHSHFAFYLTDVKRFVLFHSPGFVVGKNSESPKFPTTDLGSIANNVVRGLDHNGGFSRLPAVLNCVQQAQPQGMSIVQCMVLWAIGTMVILH